MFLLAILLSTNARVTPVDGPSLPLKVCRGLPARVYVDGGAWTNGAYGVDFVYTSPLTVQDLATRYHREVPGSPKGSFSHNFYHFARYQGSVYQDCRITKNFGLRDPKMTAIVIMETPDPTQPPPRRWYRKAISLKPPVPLIQVPFESSVIAQTVVPLFRATTATKSRPSPREGSIFEANLSEPLASVSRKAGAWLDANGYRTIRANEWFKPNVPLFEVGIADQRFRGTTTGTNVTMYLSSTNNDHPMPYGNLSAG